MPKLERSLGLVACTMMGMGVILGAGIYALVGRASYLAGNAVWISFIASAVVASFTGLSYAELASFIPRAGGEYHYAQRAFGKFVAFLVTWLLLGGLAIASAAVALGFGGYFTAISGLGLVPSAVILIIAATALLLYGIRESAIFASICTALEIIGLLAVIAIGAPHLGSVSFTEMPNGWSGVAAAAALIFFAFIGFEEIVQLAEETQNPTRNIPIALLASIVLCTVLYVLVALAAISVVGWEELGTSDSPLADVASKGAGWSASAVMSLIALFSTANTVLILLMSASRLLYGMGEDGAMPRVLARVHQTRKSPYVATLIVASTAILICAMFDRIEQVASLVNFSIFATFLLINAAVIALRFKEPDVPRPFRTPVSLGKVPLIPVLGILSVLAMMTQVDAKTWGFGTGLIVIGTIVYALHTASGGRSTGEPPGSSKASQPT